MGTDAAPLKQTILQSGLCKQVQASLDEEMRDIPYLLIFRGGKPEEGEALERLVLKRLEEIAQEGIPHHLVEGAIHQLEFDRLEISGGGYPYGLQLFFRSILLQQHGGNSEEGLQVHKLFKQLRERCQDPAYLSTLLRLSLIHI